MKRPSRDQFFLIAAVGLPLIGTVIGRYLPGRAGPSIAAAAVPVMSRPDAPQEEEEASLDFQIPQSLRETGAVEKLYRDAHQKQFTRTPLQRAPKYQAAKVQDNSNSARQNPDEKKIEAMAAFKTFELTSIVTGRETLAVIGGRPRHVGDVLKKGWKLILIDTANNYVVLEHEAGGKQTLQIRQRPLKSEPGDNPLEIIRRGPGTPNEEPAAPPTEPR